MFNPLIFHSSHSVLDIFLNTGPPSSQSCCTPSQAASTGIVSTITPSLFGPYSYQFLVRLVHGSRQVHAHTHNRHVNHDAWVHSTCCLHRFAFQYWALFHNSSAGSSFGMFTSTSSSLKTSHIKPPIVALRLPRNKLRHPHTFVQLARR